MTLADAIALYEQFIGSYDGPWHHSPDPEELEGLEEGILSTWPRIRPVIEAAANEGDDEAKVALRQGDVVHQMVNEGPLRTQRWRDKYQGEFGPVSEADITRAPPPGDSPVRHAHEDDEQLYAVHEHPGGREPHEHEWDEN